MHLSRKIELLFSPFLRLLHLRDKDANMIKAIFLLNFLHFFLGCLVPGCITLGPFDSECISLAHFEVGMRFGELVV